MGVILGQTTEDELGGFLFGLFFVSTERVDAIGARLRRHQGRQEDGAAHGEGVEQARGADGIEAHEDVTLGHGVHAHAAQHVGLGEQRGGGHALGCLKLLLAQVGKGAERFLTSLKLLTVDAGEKSTLSREHSSRESCHFLLFMSKC